MITYTCDGCGKTAEAERYPTGEPCKPRFWWQRRGTDSEGQEREIHACCREHVKAAESKFGIAPMPFIPF